MRVVWCSLLFVINVFAFDHITAPSLENFLEEPIDNESVEPVENDNVSTLEEFDEPLDNEFVENDNRIVGGQEADIVDYPHQVSFIFNESYFCGGSIINEHHILTAAHCTLNVAPTSILLRAGSSYRNNGTIIPIAEVYTHPEYNNPQYDKDVGVLKTQHPINFTDTIQPIKLVRKGRRVKSGSRFDVSGWGRTVQGGPLPIHLMDVNIPVVSQRQCYMSYPTILTNNMFCGGNFYFGGQGTCQGDSGGTAVQNGLAIGIVSFGRGCGQALSPSVFADIASPPIRDFITQHTGL